MYSTKIKDLENSDSLFMNNIQNYPTEKFSSKLKIKTSKSETVATLEWKELFNSGAMDKIYVNWNPAINKFRKKIHFSICPESYISENYSECSVFNFYKKTQILFSLDPHNEKNECRFIFERHRKDKNDVLYEIRINLYGYNKSRMFVETECYKSLKIREDENFEIISDTMIFEECMDYDNYIICVEAVPLAFLQHLSPTYGYSNQSDPLMNSESRNYFINGNLKLRDDQIMTMNVFGWFNFDMVTIPFREMVQTCHCTFLNMKDLILKLEVLESCEVEIRIENDLSQKFGIEISSKYEYNMDDDRNELEESTTEFIAKNQILRQRANIINVQLEKGKYFLNFIIKECDPNINKTKEELHLINKVFFKKKNYKGTKIFINAYNDNYFDNFEASILKIDQTKPEIEKVNDKIIKETKKIEKDYFSLNIIKKFDLQYSKILKGKLTVENNYGERKFDIKSIQNVHYNPGYILSLRNDTQIQIEMNLSNPSKDQIMYKICIYKIKDDLKMQSIMCSDYYITEEFFKSKIYFLQKNKNGYLILLIPRFSDFYCDISMTVKSDIKITKISSNSKGICSFPWLKEINGSINHYQGGLLKKVTFLLNQNYIVKIGETISKDKQDLFVEIRCLNSKEIHVGVYLIHLKSPIDLISMSRLTLESASMNKIFLSEFNSKYFKVVPGYYMIVPTSFENMKTEPKLNYKMKIYSSSECSLIKDSFFNFGQELVREIKETKRKTLILDINETDSDILLVIELIYISKEESQIVNFILGWNHFLINSSFHNIKLI